MQKIPIFLLLCFYCFIATLTEVNASQPFQPPTHTPDIIQSLAENHMLKQGNDMKAYHLVGMLYDYIESEWRLIYFPLDVRKASEIQIKIKDRQTDDIEIIGGL